MQLFVNARGEVEKDKMLEMLEHYEEQGGEL